jgi:ferritin-like protein
MEKVYSVLHKDESWWENFYRVQGYHYANEGNVTKAAEKRRKSLEIITKQLKENKGDNPRKLLYYISGAMKHFLEDDLSAIADLQIGLETKYEEKGLTAEELNDREIGMNERIKDFIERIKSDKKPRMMLGK